MAWCYQIEITQEAITAWGTERISVEVGVAWCYEVERLSPLGVLRGYQ